MTFDLIIRRGLIVDGKGEEPFIGDIAIDGDVVAEGQTQLVNDFPGGVPRLIQTARGYRATICNGSVIVSEGELTGERAGQDLRKSA